MTWLNNHLEPRRVRMAARVALLGLPALVLGILAFYASQPVAIAQMAGQQAQVTPFTLRRAIYLFENGQRDEQPSDEQVLARRSDGSIVHQGADFGKIGLVAGYTSRFITFWDGRQYNVSDAIERVTLEPTLKGRALAVSHYEALHPSDCVGPYGSLLGYEHVDGVRAAKVRAALPQPNTFIIDWRAPSLGCASLQYHAQARQSDGSLETTAEGELVSLKIGEPNPSLFEVPSGYARVKPSEFMKREAEGLGLWNKGLAAYSARLDAAYNAKMLKAGQQP